MMTPEDELIERSQPAEDRPCRNCGHPAWRHRSGPYVDTCDCLCENYEPAGAEDILTEEGKI